MRELHARLSKDGRRVLCGRIACGATIAHVRSQTLCSTELPGRVSGLSRITTDHLNAVDRPERLAAQRGRESSKASEYVSSVLRPHWRGP